MLTVSGSYRNPPQKRKRDEPIELNEGGNGSGKGKGGKGKGKGKGGKGSKEDMWGGGVGGFVRNVCKQLNEKNIDLMSKVSHVFLTAPIA